MCAELELLCGPRDSVRLNRDPYDLVLLQGKAVAHVECKLPWLAHVFVKGRVRSRIAPVRRLRRDRPEALTGSALHSLAEQREPDLKQPRRAAQHRSSV